MRDTYNGINIDAVYEYEHGQNCSDAYYVEQIFYLVIEFVWREKNIEVVSGCDSVGRVAASKNRI